MVNVNQKQEEQKLQFKITNNRSSNQTIKLSTADFNTLGESGGLAFVGTNPTELQKKYGLAHWLRLDETVVNIKPKQTTVVTATVLNESDLTPGGHYGALMLTLGSDGTNNQNKVSLKPIASSLLFITKLGGDTHKLALEKVYAKHNLVKLPNEVDLRFYNSGNTHVIPRGIINLEDSSGRVVKRGVINENSSLILPETNRIYTVPLVETAHSKSIGKYKLIIDYRFDGYDQYRRYQESLFYIHPLIILGTIFVILLIVGFVYYLVKNPRFKKHFKAFKKFTNSR